ncbi:MAG: outer membrane beta-barrel protein [Phaeodactylibacter sp.]|uniref:outer membrane beta-barrel protein n=1 Tax=Phaeodactylibacter sp. TaxID=1940289 RepID=UPI0032EE08F8
MKKLFLSLTVLCLTIQFVQAQRFEPHIDINLGIGVLPTFVKDHGKAKMLPMSLTADYKFTKNFSLGLAASYSVTESGVHQFLDGTTAQWRNNFSTVTMRAAAHSSLLQGCWNIYGGLNVGYTDSNIEMMQGEEEKVKAERGIGRTGSNFLYTAFLGTRYCLGKKIGLFGEVGFGVSIATVGISVRL